MLCLFLELLFPFAANPKYCFLFQVPFKTTLNNCSILYPFIKHSHPSYLFFLLLFDLN